MAAQECLGFCYTWMNIDRTRLEKFPLVKYAASTGSDPVQLEDVAQ